MRHALFFLSCVCANEATSKITPAYSYHDMRYQSMRKTGHSFQGSDSNLYLHPCNIYTLRCSFKSQYNLERKMISANYSSLEPMADNNSKRNRTLSTIWHTVIFKNSCFSMIFVRTQFYIKQFRCPSDCHRHPLICVNALCQSTCRFSSTHRSQWLPPAYR